jgi:fibro-slime domain-containing protein
MVRRRVRILRGLEETMKYATVAAGVLFGLALGACASHQDSSGTTASSGSTSGSADGGVAEAGGQPQNSGSSEDDGATGAFYNEAAAPADNGDAGAGTTPGTLMAVVRDFRFYDAGDPTTDPDFENPPTTGASSFDDHDIVTDTLGPDQKPVYKTPGSTTLTTHGQADFDKWYRDTDGTNLHVDFPLPLTTQSDGSFGYDSEVSGVPYNVQGQTGDGFFPIDDGSPYQTAFGNQGEPHNYSFTVEIHTVFTYKGGEYFNFRGDDDVFVYIGGKLVINLGGIHGPEAGMVSLDTLGLTVGSMYPLDFFSAERHVVGSNIKFETTLVLQPPPPK